MVPVSDVFGVVEISVVDEDPSGRYQTLGAIAVPMLGIKSGQAQWFALKSKGLLKPGKGTLIREDRLTQRVLNRLPSRPPQLGDSKSASLRLRHHFATRAEVDAAAGPGEAGTAEIQCRSRSDSLFRRGQRLFVVARVL